MKITSMLAALALVSLGDLASAQSMQEVLGAGDTVRISAYRYPDLTTTARLSEEGKVDVPMIGPTMLRGMTPDQAARHIAERLKTGNFILDPQITVSVVDARSRMVFVLGFVKNPGRYALDGMRSRLTDVIAMAGGLVPEASDVAVVQRVRNGRNEAVNVDLASIIQRGEVANNLELASGDSVFVAKAPLVYVYGEVTKGGSYRLEPGMTVMQAIAAAGGVTPRGSERRARLRTRSPGGEWKEAAARPSDAVSPNDVVFIPESLF
jgi:polysaccharide export outer membrane protein